MYVIKYLRRRYEEKDQETIKEGAWVAQSVKHQTLDFGSGHDLRLMRLRPMSGSVLGMEPT